MDKETSLIITKSNSRLLSPESLETDNIRILTFLNQPGFSKSTKENYTRILREFFIFFKSYGIKDITDVHVTLYLKSLIKKAATKNLILKAISSLYGYLVKTGYVETNPAAVIKPEKVADKFRSKILEFDQINRMIEIEELKRNKILLKILYYYGLRISETLSLTPRSFRLAEEGGAYMTVLGKGTKVRTIFLPEDIFIEVEEFMNGLNLRDENFLFYTKDVFTPSGAVAG